MFTKEILMDLFKKNEGLNYCIYTDIGVGRGINGVDFRSFIGELIDDRDKIQHVIKGFTDNCIVIEKSTSGYYYSDAKKDIYVPYEKIVMVDFITDTAHRYYKFTGRHNLKEI